eukprot:gene377-548_t
MRTLIDLPDDDVASLDRLAQRHGRSRAAEVREAVRAHLRGSVGNDWIARGFGYWRDREDIAMSDPVFDTNILIDWLRMRPEASLELSRYARHRISRITWTEILAGEPLETRDHVRMLIAPFDRRPPRISVVATGAAVDAEAAVMQSLVHFAKGQTVVLKILSKDITHKSDVGGVILNLSNPDAVRTATNELFFRARTKRPDAQIDGVIVQPMMVRSKARELILGIANDPTFGTIVVFGRGGNARALSLPPLDLNLARDLVGRTRVSRILAAYRDVPAVKPGEVERTLVKVAQLAADLPQISELDINPLLADENGVIAVDARVAVRPVLQKKFAGPGNGNFAVRPYPSQWH